MYTYICKVGRRESKDGFKDADWDVQLVTGRYFAERARRGLIIDELL